MDKLPIKLTNFSALANSFIEKIQLLDSPSVPEQYKVMYTHELKEVAAKIRDFFHDAKCNTNEEDSNLLKHKIKRIYENFEWEVNLLTKSSLDFKKCSEYAKSMILSILKVLGRKGCGTLILETYLKISVQILNDMINTNQATSTLTEDVRNFKTLLEGLSSLTGLLKKYWYLMFLESQKKLVLLALSQISKCLVLLLNIIEQENKGIRRYVVERLKMCFELILKEVHSDEDSLASNCGSEFINLMDSALYLLNQLSREMIEPITLLEIANDCFSSLKNVVDELLCHAMSMAQVTNIQDDNKQIIFGSQKVLRECEELNQAIKNEDIANIKFNASSLSETLCHLEQKVNTAVLRLVLEVFTEVNTPLKNLIVKCRVNAEVEGKLPTDLNTYISDFDIEMDRIMQIGLFAISCTTDVKRILGIRSCLASLESLEAELVPCLTALYMDTSRTNKMNFKFLIDHWLKEVTELKTLVDSILDPCAFTEVIQNRIQDLLLELKNETQNNDLPIKQKDIVMNVVKFSKKLIRTLQTSIKDDTPKDAKQITIHLIELQKAVQECEASSALLNTDQDINRTSSRILKRCKMVMTSINNLHLCLTDLLQKNDNVEDSDSEGISSYVEIWNSTRMPVNNYYKLYFSNHTSLENENNLEVLTPFLDRGKLLNRERSIMYMTPRRSEPAASSDTPRILNKTLMHHRLWDKTPRSKNRSRCCKILSREFELENSLDLEITTILENLSQLSHTFHQMTNTNEQTSNFETSDQVIIGQNKGTEVNISDLRGCCTNFDVDLKDTEKLEENLDVTFQSDIGSQLRKEFSQTLTGLSQISYLHLESDIGPYDTLQRMHDLEEIEQKIIFLKQQVPDLLP